MSRKSSRLVEDIELEYAAHPPRSGTGAGDVVRVQHFLHMPVERVIEGPGPVMVPVMVNGRPLRSWERVLYREAMTGERRRELALFAGLIP